MEKRAVLAIALSVLILLGWLWLFPPPKPEPQTAAPPASATADEPPPPESPAVSPDAVPAPAAQAEAPLAADAPEETRVEHDRMAVVLTNRGGRVRSWTLRDYRDSAGKPLELVPAFGVREDLLPAAVDLDDEALAARINSALFRIERETIGDAPGGGERIVLRWADGQGLSVRKELTFRRGDWLVDIRLDVTDRGRRLPARLAWGPGFEALDPKVGSSQIHYTGQVVIDQGGSVTRTRRVKETTVARETGRLRWAGLDEQFFAALILPAGGRGDVVVRPLAIAPEPPPDAAPDASKPKPVPQMLVAVGIPPEGARLFVGPKKYTLLRDLGQDLDAVVWFSSYSLIYWLAKYLFLALLWIHESVVSNYGLAIILATVVLRLLFFPLNQYSMVQMRKMQTQMQRIQPKINAIKAKYKKMKDAKDRGKMNEEMMALYRKEGVNPMGGMSGCLPMLLQLPILIAFYNVLTVAVELRAAPFFGWIGDLTLKDPLYVTPLLMGATMFIQQKMTTTKGGDPLQQRMMMMMPAVFTVMFLNLPSGLTLYWFVNNVLGIGQQWLVNRHIGRIETAGAA